MAISINNLFSQANENKNMSFKVTQVDLGVINEQDGVKSTTFTFTNIGTAPLVINGVSVSCGCTNVVFVKDPVMPGKSSNITVTYDPEFRPGFFDKKIYVYSDKRRKRNVLSIKGEVLGRPKSTEDTYPFNVGGGVLAASSAVEFGYIPIGYSHSLSLDIYNNSDNEVRIDIPRSTVGLEYSYYLTTPKLAAKSRGQIIVTFDFKQSERYEIYKFKIPIFVDGSRVKGGDIEVSAVSIPDVSKVKITKGVPSIFVPDVYHSFSLEVGMTHIFEVENEGDRDLKIIQVLVEDEGLLSYDISSSTIKPHSKEQISVTISPSTKIGRVNSRILLITNDPASPISEIRIAVNITEKRK